MPYIRRLGYIKTGPRPRQRLREIESHNAMMGTSSSGYSLRSRPDNLCLVCNHRWVPHGKNLSTKCPNCKNNSVITSREIDSFKLPNQPKQPSYFDSAEALSLISLPIISLVFIFSFLYSFEYIDLLWLSIIIIGNVFLIKYIKPRANLRFDEAKENYNIIYNNWQKFCKKSQNEFEKWHEEIKKGLRTDTEERNWDLSEYNY